MMVEMEKPFVWPPEYEEDPYVFPAALFTSAIHSRSWEVGGKGIGEGQNANRRGDVGKIKGSEKGENKNKSN